MDEGIQTRSKVRGNMADSVSTDHQTVPLVVDTAATDGQASTSHVEGLQIPEVVMATSGNTTLVDSVRSQMYGGETTQANQGYMFPQAMYRPTGTHARPHHSDSRLFESSQARARQYRRPNFAGGQLPIFSEHPAVGGDRRESTSPARGCHQGHNPSREYGYIPPQGFGPRGDYYQPPVTPAARMRIPLYDGKSKWVTFIRQFEAIAFKSAWSEDAKLAQLLASLSGLAADYAFQLEPEDLEDYEMLTAQLERRFKLRQTRDTCQQLFYSRIFKPGETPSQYAADLKSLILRAFPDGLSYQVREEMLIKQFFDGLQDEDARYYVKYLKHPRSVDEAVDLLHEYRAYRGKGKDSRRSAVRMVYQEDQPQVDQSQESSDLRAVYHREKSAQAKEFEALKSSVNDLTKAVTQMVDSLASVKGPRRGNSQPGNAGRKCFNCGGMGHWSRECPSPKQPKRATDSEQKEGAVEKKPEQPTALAEKKLEN